MKTLCICSLSVLFVLLMDTRCFPQSIHKCKTVISGGRYQWAHIDPLLKDSRSYFGFVLVKPKDMNRAFLMDLGRRLKDEYCEAAKLQVVIFDNRKHANSNSLADYTSSKGKIILMRGFYSFDKNTGKNLLEFSTKPGNPTTEVQIDLEPLERK